MGQNLSNSRETTTLVSNVGQCLVSVSSNESEIELTKIRDLIIRDGMALEKWPLIVDQIVPAVVDRKRVQKLLTREDIKYEEAVLKSLHLWYSSGSERPSLIDVMRNLKLNALADKLYHLEIETGIRLLKSSAKASSSTGVWFGIGEVVHNFTGREKELDTLHKMLTGSRSTESSLANVISIYGLGGIGKSTLARKYAFTCRNVYDGNVVWINAETIGSMRTSFIHLIKGLELSYEEKESNEYLTARVYDNFRDKKSLFIFDNVEDKGDFKKFQPNIVNPSDQFPYLLVTTRRNDISPISKNQLNLEILSREEAATLIQMELPKVDPKCVTNLAEKLHRFPLALQQALAYIKEKYLSDQQCISKYIDAFDASEKKLLNDDTFKEYDNYTRTTFTTWNVTLKWLQKKDKSGVAVQLIRTLAYLSPDVITVQFLETIFTKKTELGLKMLETYSMISVQDERILIHRLVQHVIRLSLSSQQEKKMLQSVIEVTDKLINRKIQLNLKFNKKRQIQRSIPQVINKLTQQEFTDLTKKCTSHGLHFFKFQAKYPKLMLSRAGYFTTLCANLICYGHFDDSLKISERTAELFESCHKSRNPKKWYEDVLRMKRRSAEAHHCLQNFPKALEILNNILVEAEQNLGKTHTLTQHIHSSIARAHTATGNYQIAVDIYDNLIGMNSERDHFTVWAFQFNMAKALQHLGRLEEALELYQLVYEKRAGFEGEDGFRTLNALEAIGDIVNAKGDAEKAHGIWQRVSEGYVTQLGNKHPDTVRVRGKLEGISGGDINSAG